VRACLKVMCLCTYVREVGGGEAMCELALRWVPVCEDEVCVCHVVLRVICSAKSTQTVTRICTTHKKMGIAATHALSIGFPFKLSLINSIQT
jgi:hypothetical protein